MFRAARSKLAAAQQTAIPPRGSETIGFDIGSRSAEPDGFLPDTFILLQRKPNPRATIKVHGHISINFRDNPNYGEGFDTRCRQGNVKVYLLLTMAF